jgi:hypothetical protein
MAKKFTPWFKMNQNPVRTGEYEGLASLGGHRLVVHWRRLQDTDKYDWYFEKGSLGPFNLWESARRHMTAWRGLTSPAPKGQP